jgi:mRNA-degrading endonuclease RelE of RelBE toxin-antitoxin system
MDNDHSLPPWLTIDWKDEHFVSVYDLNRRLKSIWTRQDGQYASPWRKAAAQVGNLPLPPASWQAIARKDFLRAVGSADKPMRERVLDALKSICVEPLIPIGNTKSPMQGNLSGLWRYRIGEYRVIYRPILEQKQVELLAFTSRQSAYDRVDA